MRNRRPPDHDRSRDTRIGPVLKGLRKRAGVSLRTLAERAGFSASFLSLLEKGQVSPSIASLERIARALGVTLVDLFQEAHDPTRPVVRATERPAFTSSWSRARVESLSSSKAAGIDHLEALAITIAPSGTSGAHLTDFAEGQFAYQLKGALTLFMRDERIVLKPGDAVTISPRTPHRWQNEGRRGAQILLIFIGRRDSPDQ